MARLTRSRFTGAEGYRFVLDELPMDQGWALLAWDIHNDPWLATDIDGKAYIAQHVDTLMAMIK